MNNLQLVLHFFIQVAVILLFCRLVGAVAARLGQPQVVAEMLAGVLLGPSLFGLFWPEAQTWLFPWDTTQQTRDTQSYLFPASQLGLALYMFVIGMEFRIDIVRRTLKSAVAVSIAGIAVPLLFGAALAWVFFHYTDLFPTKTSLMVAMLFLGASMCITALPVLARIIQFKNLSGTPIGTVALGAGAINDATAWCLLAVVLASLDDNWSRATANIGGGIAYVAFTLLVIRPLLARAKGWLIKDGALTEAGLATALALMALGAWFTDLVGLHAVFGAFVMGAAMPRGLIAQQLIDRIQPLTVALLLPLFFTYSGLNTKIGTAGHRLPLADVRGRPRRGDARQRRGLLAGRACHRHSESGSHGHRHADERAGTDGIDHHQHRPSTRDHFGRSLRGACHHGRRHHGDGLAGF